MKLAWVIASLLPVAQELPPIEVEGQPLAANAERLAQALDFLGAPLPEATRAALRDAGEDAKRIQLALDPRVLVVVSINPESRVKAARGPAAAQLQQGAFVPVLVKVVNDSPVKAALGIGSPQSGPVFSGGGAKGEGDPRRFLQVEMFSSPPMTANLSGLKVEYALALIYSTEAGKREATIAFDVGQGTQDLGFRGETPVLFDVRPGVRVKLAIRDFDGAPTTARLTFTDKLNHVYPPPPKRLAPDFFFQRQIYRPDGGTVLLPPGELTMLSGRGPEYHQRRRTVTIPASGEASLEIKLERWINPAEFGFYSGDHHIHAAGCLHYTNPSEGVHAPDMFLHVKGEGLNVGCNLTWGPCYDYQRQFFEPGVHKLSEPFTVLKYDIEVSGFGSQALGHVCVLNLKDQTYPGSDGTSTKGWPTWTTPLMKWAKKQGAVCGYAHSASGLGVNPGRASRRLADAMDADRDGKLAREEAARVLLPEPFEAVDADGNGDLSLAELEASHKRVVGKLPNYAIPEMDGIGAQEICVTVAQGLCDFISAMDTARVPEWNCWYHIMNSGFPLKASGETDFPCVSGSRVGSGRVYVRLGKVDRIDFTAWCEGLARGRSYVSDGYAHAVEFQVEGRRPGERVERAAPGAVEVRAKVAFAAETPLGTASGGFIPGGGRRTVELVINGQVAAEREVPADDRIHELTFSIPVERSSWIALRQFPQMHTNPVEVIVGGKPIRASRRSALWCIGTIEQLWRVRGEGIAPHERDEAKRTFEAAIEQYRRIAAECPEGS
jgi:hypothetical protein